jgi:hypothetical protein
VYASDEGQADGPIPDLVGFDGVSPRGGPQYTAPDPSLGQAWW